MAKWNLVIVIKKTQYIYENRQRSNMGSLMSKQSINIKGFIFNFSYAFNIKLISDIYGERKGSNLEYFMCSDQI